MRIATACGLGSVALAAGLAGVVTISTAEDPAQRQALAGWVAAAAGQHHRTRPGTGVDRPADEGLAFDAYREAVHALETLDPDAGERAKLALRTSLEECLEDPDPDLAPVLAALSKGAGRSDATYPLDVSQPLDGQLANLLDWRTLTNVVGAATRRRAARGDGEGAVSLALDTLTMATDVLGAPLLIQQMIGCALVAIVTDQVLDDDVLSCLDGDARQALADGLARLDGSLHLWCDGRAEAIVFGHQALGPDGSGEAIATSLGLAMFWDEVARNPSDGWTARQAQLDELGSRHTEEPLSSVAKIVTNCERMNREAVARIRLLRLAALPADAPPIALDDPIGDGPIRATHDDGGSVVYRAGNDPSAAHLSRRAQAR
jgi:hypothetical protein